MNTSTALGADWATPVSGLWTDADKWIPTDAPNTSTENAIIAVSGTPFEITLDTPLTISELTLSSFELTLTLNENLQVGTSTTAGKVTFDRGTLAGPGVINIYGGPLEIGSSGPQAPVGGTFNLISHSSAAINKVAGSFGGDVLAGMTVNFKPLQNSSNLSVHLHSAFANRGTLTITPSLDNATVPVHTAGFTNHGQLTTFANANGNGAIGFMLTAFTNETTGVVNFNTSAFFSGSNSIVNRGTMTVAVGNYYIQVSDKFVQASGSLNVGSQSLFSPMFEYQAGTITGIIDTTDLQIAPGVSGATVRLKPTNSGHAIIRMSGGTGGNLTAGMNVSATAADGVTGVRVGAAFANDGALQLTQTAGNNVYLSTNGASGDGTFTNRGTYTVTAADASNEHELRGAFVNDTAGVATFDSNASITGNATNHGDIVVAGASRALDVAGDFTQSATGTLGITLGSGGASGSVAVATGTATLAGALEISLANGFDPLTAPPEELSFQILTASSVNDTFDTILGRYVLDGKFWEPTYTATDVTIALAQATPGDADIDGDVDIDDLTELAANYGQANNLDWLDGDFDHDGDVDLSDLTRLATYYGGGQEQAIADFQHLSTIPEPATASLLLLIPWAASRRRCR